MKTRWFYWLACLGLVALLGAGCSGEDRGTDRDEPGWDIGPGTDDVGDTFDASHEADADGRDTTGPVDPRDTSEPGDTTGEPDVPGEPDTTGEPDATEEPDTNPQPVQCRNDAACGSEYCDLAAGVCVECLLNAHCGEGERCDGRQCVARVGCTNSLGCVEHDDRPICSPVLGECVECAFDADCEGDAECVDRVCRPYSPCNNSLDCGSEHVCDPASGRCVDCVVDADCEGEAVCRDAQCVDVHTCSSDRECTPHGLLCDRAAGECRQCLRDVDCPQAYHCAEGQCQVDICSPGEGRCVGEAVALCNEVGDGFAAPVACRASQVCVESGSQAACQERICTPGLQCAGDTVVECYDRGLSVRTLVDCALSGERCSDGACEAQYCEPNTLYCDGNWLVECDATGYVPRTVEVCGAGEQCDATGDEPGCRCVPCADSTACGAGAPLCVDGCCAECVTNADCASHEICDGNACIVPGVAHGIRIVLTWTHEHYPNPVSGYGVDFDLHYRHPLGTWNTGPYSVFWRYRTQDWGTSTSPSVASLVLDDMYGIGPEEIIHTNPVDGLNYDVGVHYYSDRGAGAGEATIQIFVRDTLVYRKTRLVPVQDTFWHVGTIQWPSGTVVEHDQQHVGFPAP